MSKNVYSSWAKEEEGEKKSLRITNELSVQQPCDYIIALGALNPTYVHRLTITTKVTVIYQHHCHWSLIEVVYCWDKSKK